MPPQRGASASPPTASTLSRGRHAPAQPKNTLIKTRWPSPAATAPTLRGHGVQALPGARDCSGGPACPPYPAGLRCARSTICGAPLRRRVPHTPPGGLRGSCAPSFGPACTPPRIGGGVRALASLRSSGAGGPPEPAPPPALSHPHMHPSTPSPPRRAQLIAAHSNGRICAACFGRADRVVRVAQPQCGWRCWRLSL